MKVAVFLNEFFSAGINSETWIRSIKGFGASRVLIYCFTGLILMGGLILMSVSPPSEYIQYLQGRGDLVALGAIVWVLLYLLWLIYGLIRIIQSA
jgi:hypothetical protein